MCHHHTDHLGRRSLQGNLTTQSLEKHVFHGHLILDFFFFIPPKDTLMPQSDESNDFFLAEMEVIPHRINVAMCLLCAEHCATCCKRELKGLFL